MLFFNYMSYISICQYLYYYIYLNYRFILYVVLSYIPKCSLCSCCQEPYRIYLSHNFVYITVVYPHLSYLPASQKNAVTISRSSSMLPGTSYLVQVSVLVSLYRSVMFPQLISIIDMLTLYVSLIYHCAIRLVYIYVLDYLIPYTLYLSCVYSE